MGQVLFLVPLFFSPRIGCRVNELLIPKIILYGNLEGVTGWQSKADFFQNIFYLSATPTPLAKSHHVY